MPVTRSQSKATAARSKGKAEPEATADFGEDAEVSSGSKRKRTKKESARSASRRTESASSRRRTRRRTDEPHASGEEEHHDDDGAVEREEEVQEGGTHASSNNAPTAANGSRIQIQGEWIPGESDVRTRAPVLMRIIAQLYRLRWDQSQNDRFKMIHWNRVANIMDELETPVKTEDDVLALGNIRGIGEATVRLLQEIRETGYVDWMDDLMAEVEHLVNERGIADRVIAFNELLERAESLGERNAEDRASRRRALVERMGQIELEPKHAGKIDDLMNQAVIVTGAQRRKLCEVEKQKSASSTNPPPVERYETRHARKEKRVKAALHSAVQSESCAICLEEYSDTDKLAAYDCTHCFHVDCIKEWLQSRVHNAVRPHCPLCRRPIGK